MTQALLHATVLAAIPPALQTVLDAAQSSWARHDTLKFLAAGVVLLIVSAIGQKREWSGVLVGLLLMGGIGGVLAAGVMGLLGDEVRKGPRVVHLDPVPLGGPCRSTGDCEDSALCVREGEEPLRCRARCGKDADCSGGTSCRKAHGGKVCLR